MESGDVTIARQGESALLPARGMVVLACNPCPCGEWRAHAGANRCKCRETVRRDYQRKISGPITDRVDITRHVEPLSPHAEHDRFDLSEASEAVRERVDLARRLQAIRYADCSWRLNAHAPGQALRQRWPLSPDGQRAVDDAVFKGRLTRRGAVRVHRVAWTVADLASVRVGVNHDPGAEEVDIALRLRLGAPLLARTVQAVAG
jgi:magnesium chelatase family protein